MKRTIIFLIILSFSYFTCLSQSEQVKTYLKKVAQGKIDEVKMALPDLLADYPDDAGVLLLHASVLDDANKAIDIYERIVKKHPESAYADDAYWRIVQYYAIKGELEKASQELEAYRKKFPTSEFLAPAADVLRTAIALSKSSSKSKAAVNLIADKAKKEEPAVKKEKKTEVQPPAAKPQPEKPKVKDKPAPPKKTDYEDDYNNDGTWGLQVGCYSSQERAKSEVERFKSLRLRAEIMPKKIDGVTMYAVIIGDYSTKEAAEAAKNIVQQQCDCSPLIFQK